MGITITIVDGAVVVVVARGDPLIFHGNDGAVAVADHPNVAVPPLFHGNARVHGRGLQKEDPVPVHVPVHGLPSVDDRLPRPEHSLGHRVRVLDDFHEETSW